MAFEDRKGELLAAIGYEKSRLDTAKLTSNVTEIRHKIRYFFNQDYIKNEWQSHHLALRGSLHNEFLREFGIRYHAF